ncbi:sulfite exporter TauE/SafE family protein [uncultured Cetobacterium sp.]|uniref:sulfite exporter TauE/SafE family protein n=1 Tax=uncultured Cetobacterium sp. TaxID=527638 RepID=UPI00262D9BE6|nr:sulfite exporter TauE/SafE family protein [uncultured Cetobacterium sp.]
MFFIYFLTSIIATSLGALAGLGGGVIIKPVLDTLGTYDLGTIGILSSFTVFSMAIVSIFKQVKCGFKIELRMIILAVGSILGGGLGQELFDIFLNFISNDRISMGIQSLILASLLIGVLFKNKLPKYHIKHPIFILFLGIILGATASFLGIGGGPINVAILVMFLSIPIKEAATNSVFIILLSQFSKLFLIGISGSLMNYNLTMLPYMIIGGISGGLIGSKLNKSLTYKSIESIFNFSLIGIIALNLFNAYKAFL